MAFKKKSTHDQHEEYFWNGFLVHEFYREPDPRDPYDVQLAGVKGKSLHPDVIVDLCEIHSPMLIATASLDKRIRLISLQEKKVIGEFTGHLKGVRQLDYTSFMDGFILSVGHETYVNVWTLEGGMGAIQSTYTQSSISRGTAAGGKAKQMSNLVGRLSKGNNLMKFARFLHNSSFCTSVDEKFVCKLWNFTNQQLLQTIQPYQGGSQDINDILVFKNLKRFAIVCKRLIFFDTYTINQLLNQQNADPRAVGDQQSMLNP